MGPKLQMRPISLASLKQSSTSGQFSRGGGGLVGAGSVTARTIANNAQWNDQRITRLCQMA